MQETHSLWFAPFRLDLGAEQLWRGTEARPLTRKAFAALRYLVSHAGQLVTKEALITAVWDVPYVSDMALAACIREIRRALDEHGHAPQFLETVRGRGYRFCAPVTLALPAPEAPEASPSPALPRPAPEVLVGRSAELAQLQQCWARAQHGVRQVVLLTGEAGIGKTALVDAFVAQLAASDSPWLGRGQCVEPYGAGEAYLPLLEAVGQLGRAPDGARLVALLQHQAPSWLLHLPALVSATELEALQQRSSGTTRERMLRELAEAVETLSAEHPLVLVLEDLHWSDGATLEWLAYVARRRAAARLLVVGTYRLVDAVVYAHPVRTMVQELQLHHDAQVLALDYLQEPEITAYLRQRFGHLNVPEGFARFLHQRTTGNPLFLVTIVDTLVQQGVLRPHGTRWEVPDGLATAATEVPDSLRQLIERYLERLEPEDQGLLEVASVAGQEFAVAAVAAGQERTVDAVEAQCAALARRGQFVRECGIDTWADGTVATRYSFLHNLYRETIYARVPAGRRRRWHAQVGHRLERGYGLRARDMASELAMHFQHGHETPKAVDYLCLAGENALRLSAYQEALAHLQQGLSLLQTLPETPERTHNELRLRIALGPALMATQGYVAPAVAANYGRAHELCQQARDWSQRYPVLWGLWQFANGNAQHQLAAELGEQLLLVAEQQQDAIQVLQAHHALWNTAFHRGMLRTAQTHLAQGRHLYTSQQHHVHAVQYAVDDPGVCCLSTGAQIQWLLGYPDQAAQMSRAALRLAQTLGHPYSLAHALIDTATVAQFRREVPLVAERAEAVLALGNEHGFRGIVAQGMMLRGWAQAMQQSEEGLDQIRQGLAALQAMGTEHLQPWFRVPLIAACCHRGFVDEGRTLVEDALRITQSTGERVMESELYRLQGELYCRGDAAQETAAAACFQRALDVAGTQQAKSLELRAAMSLSRLWQRQGQSAAAYRLLAEVYDGFSEGFETADLQEARALLEVLDG